MFKKICLFILAPLALLVVGFYIGISTVSAVIDEAKYIPKKLVSVSEYGPLKIGGPWKARTYFPGPKDYPLEMARGANFFIHVAQKGPFFCMFDSCGMTGVLVECMYGWLTGDSREQGLTEVGLGDRRKEVERGDVSLVIVVDKNLKIVGLYPNATTHDIPRILKKHPEITKFANECFDYHMPPTW